MESGLQTSGSGRSLSTAPQPACEDGPQLLAITKLCYQHEVEYKLFKKGLSFYFTL